MVAEKEDGYGVGVLVSAGKLYHAAYMVRLGRYFVRRFMQLSRLHLNGEELAVRGGAWRRTRGNAEAE